MDAQPLERDFVDDDVTFDERFPIGRDAQRIERNDFAAQLIVNAHVAKRDLAKQGEVELADLQSAVDPLGQSLAHLVAHQRLTRTGV